MSGVYIKGVEMPTDHPMWIIVHSNGTVETNEISQARPFGWKVLRNAAVPVSPHGRTIDADALEAKGYCLSQLHIDYDAPIGPKVWRECVPFDEAPTIIPAEEGEVL